MLGWDAEGDPGRLDLALGAHETLGHRRLGDQERTGDLLRRETAERAQRQRHLRLERQRRVTAGEDQLQALVGKRALLHRFLCGRVVDGLGYLEQARLGQQRAVAADAVDRTPASRRHEPAGGIRGRALDRPAFRGGRKCLLRGLLGEVEVAEEADERSEDAPPQLAEGLLEGQ